MTLSSRDLLFAANPRLAEARRRCAERLRESADELAGLSPEARRELEAFAHRTYGTAGSYGFTEAAERARDLEAALGRTCDDAVDRARKALEAALRALEVGS